MAGACLDINEHNNGVLLYTPDTTANVPPVIVARVLDRDLPPNTRKALQRRYNGVTRHSNNLKRAKKKPNPNTYFVVRFRF